MQPQPYQPGSSPFSTMPSPVGSGGGGGKSPMLLILVILLGLGTVGFGTLTVLFSGKASTATKTLSSEKAAAAAAARDKQKADDDIRYTQLNESPFRAYVAPVSSGSFVINFPKNWSGFVEENGSGTRVNLYLHPDFVRKTNAQFIPTAMRVHLEDRTKDSYIGGFASLVKSGKLKQTTTTVSGQPAFDFTGEFNGGKTVREVVVPIRDKVLIFTTESTQYATEYGQILSQAKIIP